MPKKVQDSLRLGLQTEAIKQTFLDNLCCIQGKFPEVATTNDYYMALSYTVRDRLMDLWTQSARTFYKKESRTICYFSAEFLLGPQLENNLNNLGIRENVREALSDLNLNLDDLIAHEVEPGLGNGGLGRLAACYMDSLATLNIPSIGYGIRYEFGIFNQGILNGWQVENTDKWLRFGNPWEVPRPEISFDIKLGGSTKGYFDKNGRYQVEWIPHRVVKSVAYDIPMIGYQATNASFLRLWKAEAVESFDFQAFNVGDYYKAVQEKMSSENITKVLYPNDEPLVGKRLRLEQQYFFVSSALRDMIRIYLQRNKNLENFADKYAVQLNDTHPSIGVAELMRLLVDEFQIEWDKAWSITQKTFCYTNHTLLPEALEKWPLPLFKEVLPRHLEIILEINQRFLNKVRILVHNDQEKIKNLSLIDESGEHFVRMANLACIGSSYINGVSTLHSELLKKEVLRDFYDLWPDKFCNKTNGITPRRFLQLANPGLSSLITEAIGDSWVKKLENLRGLVPLAENLDFHKKWHAVKLNNKTILANIIRDKVGVEVDPHSIFDIQAKRIHEYKRQHLNALYVVTLYNRLKKNPDLDMVPRTSIFAGKAAPGYFLAKLIIKLINSIAHVVNNDKAVKNRLKVVFLPNYNVKHAERIYPAADVSEQISTAGKEASGTGNMKFSLNGALTVGTLDGANVEIREEVGDENFFLFGMTVEELTALREKGYNPKNIIENNAELKEALDLISSGYFSDGDVTLFKPLVDSIVNHDEFMLCADYQSYVDCQDKVSAVYKDEFLWTKMSILNVAHMGKFSSDRAILEYCKDIWKIKPVEIE
jgi:starch phosphorylase